MKYRRFYIGGGYYFFTVVTQNRRPILIENIELLRESFRHVMVTYPFKIEAAVILSDHLHMIWKLPEHDSKYSIRWRLIKSNFSQNIGLSEWILPSRKKRNRRGVW
ncbi:REP-associated tyrosine transposase [Pelagibaculum spongiae]|uniref:REP-associated tyrosine transposase n=1 Tax=Pelagibaculum spongiae TaxID=2080658 RepID=UPI0019D4158F|nr:transposase [Pelagibaculum spongiae]